MDSLKVPKGSSSTSSSPKSSSSNVPMAVRFNAGEECIDDIFKSNHNNGLCKNNSPSPSEGLVGISSTDLDNIEMSRSDKENIYADSVHSLSSSPSQSLQQSNDETNLKNNFLQGNFFNRKRSDSIESFSPSTPGPLPPGSATDTTSGSGGTWKLIKGKVSQTFDEIKSSKTQSTMPQQQQVFSNKMGLNQQLQEIDMEEDKSKRPNEEHKIDSESEFEHDFLLDTEVESSRLRRGLANLKSKVKSKQQQQQQQTTESQQQQPSQQQQQQAVMYSASSNTVRTVKKDKSPSRATNSQVPASGGSSLRNALLGRKRKPNATTELASPTSTLANTLGLRKRSGIEMGKKNMEIETGVEMMEDTIPIVAQTQTPSSSASQQNNELSLKSEAQSVLSTFESASLSSMELQQRLSSDSSSSPPAAQSLPGFGLTLQHFPYLLILAILVVLFLPMYEFLRGVLICLLSIALIDGLCHFGQRCIEHFLVQTPPEKDKFKIPDYSKLPIVEIPAAEEHKTVKTYAGWMNEASSYDPATFHISMTKSVYLKLEGSILHIFSTQARIPKRAMWNEVPIDRKTINFTEKRSFDLFGCRIELLPLGLARKRYFNRKYPLQLIVKKCVDNVPTQPSSKRPSTGSKDDPIFVDARSYSHANALSNTNTNSINPDDNLHEVDENSDIDFATTIMNTDLGAWQEGINPDIDLPDMTIPCGDETRLLLFSRADREKEDWYRRFVAASSGEIHDRELNLPNIRIVDDKDLQTMADRASIYSNKTKEDKTDDNNTANTQQQRESSSNQKENNISGAKTPDDDFEELDDELEFELQNAQSIEGLLMTWCAARNPADYLRFMALYQKACNQTQMPVYRKSINEKHFSNKHHHKRHQRRVQRKKDELWKGIDQSLFLGPSGSVVWANVLLGRVVYSCLHDPIILAKVQDLLQKKLASVRLPSFMEDVVITQINLGKTPPLIHRVSQPMLDERGIWMDGDVTYEGLLQITVTTKLNLLRLKKQARPGPLPDVTVLPVPSGAVPAGATFNADTPTTSNWFPASTEDNFNSESLTVDDNTHNVIYDSDAESSGGSSSETDSASANTTNAETVNADFHVFNSTSPGNARRIFKIVDRITASNFFQYATELSYVQRAMENMNANITLRIDLKGLVARAVINIPPPPSDRVWLSFRGPPRLWITAKPAVGDKSMDWSIVTNVIESKLCELVNKHLVYPNMIDFTIPLLGSPNYNNKYNPE